MEIMKLKGKTAIITGAVSGIGRAIAIRFAKEGAHVVVNDVNIEQANRVVDEIKAFGAEAIAVRADVRNSQEISSMVSTTLDTFDQDRYPG